MKTASRRSKHVGSSFEDFLAKQGILAEVDSTVQKTELAGQIEEAMRRRAVTKSQMAVLMKTSRAAVDRLLDPDNPSVTLATMNRAAIVLGARLEIGLTIPRTPKRSSRRRA